MNRHHEVFLEYFCRSNEKERDLREKRNGRNRAKEARKNERKIHTKKQIYLFIYGGYRGSSVGTLTRLWNGQPKNVGSIPGGGKRQLHP